MQLNQLDDTPEHSGVSVVVRILVNTKNPPQIIL